MRFIILAFLFVTCVTTQALACGKSDKDADFEVSVYKRAKGINCRYFKFIYPKSIGIHKVDFVEFFTDQEIGATLKITEAGENKYSSAICMNETFLETSKIIFTFITPHEEELRKKNIVSFCVPKTIEINNLAELLVVKDDDESK
ncbi:MAG: hypothetical protein ACTHOO_03235 [Alcanivorax sp.]